MRVADEAAMPVSGLPGCFLPVGGGALQEEAGVARREWAERWLQSMSQCPAEQTREGAPDGEMGAGAAQNARGTPGRGAAERPRGRLCWLSSCAMLFMAFLPEAVPVPAAILGFHLCKSAPRLLFPSTRA